MREYLDIWPQSAIRVGSTMVTKVTDANMAEINTDLSISAKLSASVMYNKILNSRYDNVGLIWKTKRFYQLVLLFEF